MRSFVAPGRRGGRKPRKLSEEDVPFIEALLRDKPTTTYKEVVEKLKQFSPIENVTEKDVSNAVKKYSPENSLSNKSREWQKSASPMRKCSARRQT